MPFFRQLMTRYSTPFLAFFLFFYIYITALYFLYSSPNPISKFKAKLEEHRSIHTHQYQNVDLSSVDKIIKFRQERYEKALKKRAGSEPGEGGKPVYLDGEEAELAKKLFPKETFNIIASNKIPMDRYLTDARPTSCRSIMYPEDLPSASVIIVFCNEAPSALLRTVHSVVNRSPPKYLHEIILVDDASERPEIGKELEDYIEKVWPDNIVKLYRSKERMGLIRGKMLGARKASGDVLIFLDAHCEATHMWIEPILARIKENRTVVLCPMIDSINDNTLQYQYGGTVAVGGFSWALHFTWRSVPEKEKNRRKSDADPARSPTMAGGLFASERIFFFELGGYDEGMDVWGGENLEISFRTWMCGGSLEFLPCSRVGHIFRAAHPYSFLQKDTHGINSKRLAEVWMDEYKRLYYLHREDLIDKDAGDLSSRIELRKSLKCHSFKWFLENVYPEKFILDEGVKGFGMVRNPSTSLCLDTLGKDEKSSFSLGIFYCQGGKSSSEIFSFTKNGEIRREDLCLDGVARDDTPLTLQVCHGNKGNQLWFYNETSNQIIHSSNDLCLDVDDLKNGDYIKMKKCKENKVSQKWVFENFNKL